MIEDVVLCDKVLEGISKAKKDVGRKKPELTLKLDYEELTRLQDLILSTRELVQ